MIYLLLAKELQGYIKVKAICIRDENFNITPALLSRCLAVDLSRRIIKIDLLIQLESLNS